MEREDEILQIFREETGERLDEIVESLLLVETDQQQPDAIDAMFRDAHSIKGNAGMAGFDEIGMVAHAMEDALGHARAAGKLQKSMIEPMLGAADALRRLLRGERGLAADVIERISLAILDATAEEPGGASVAPPAAATPAPSADVAPRSGPTADPGEQRSMRVAAAKVDRLLDAVGETMLHHRRLEHLAGDSERTDARLSEELDRGHVLFDDLQESVISMRMLPLSSITGGFPRAVRDLARERGKDVELSVSGAETQLDRAILDGISETISHVLRNAVAHGIESPQEREASGKPAGGRIELSAEQRGGMIAIEVADDGRGVPPHLLERARESGSLTDLLAGPGFSTASEVTDLSGRGVGLDAVKSHVESLGGSLEIDSSPGAGMRVVLLLPLTLALLHVLLVERGGNPYAIPLASVREAIAVRERTSLLGRSSVELRGGSVRVVDLAAMLGAAAPALADTTPGVVVAAAEHRAAVLCDRLLGEEEVVMKGLGLLAGIPGYLGGAILGDGRITMVLDPSFLARAEGRGRVGVEVPATRRRAGRVLVVDDQFTVRELQRAILEAAGYEVVTARDGS